MDFSNGLSLSGTKLATKLDIWLKREELERWV